ncbi:MAG: cytidylate kinase [Comamonadaceae bacterium CG1_02_60_18]|nr:MAG: cytidylate kinase [Comamonadaceae bacterium CG1_02_60_18]PIQ51585.1 MAG: cytidylate kinase [Comamonadaceae bacterium CG12_big_fil_rev_8_21_14_0_65_59_15]
MFDTVFLDIPPLTSAHGSVTLPGSKSISNRVLLLAALCQGVTQVHDVLDSDDTRVMLEALRTLGCGVEQQGRSVTIHGMAGQPRQASAKLFMGNAGTAIRPLTAALAVLGGDYELRGVPRMHERPIGDLVDALKQLGCQIDYLEKPGYPPLHIGQPQLCLGKPIRVRGDVSSQFLTALLMALPLVARQDVVIEVVGELISRPYIDITLNLLERFNVPVQRDGWQRFTIPAGSALRSPGQIHVEADASSASYFIAIGALAARAEEQKNIKILGVGAASIQGDIRFIDAARQMGAHVASGDNWLEVSRTVWPLRAIDLDCNHIPDAAMTLAMLALYADSTSTLRNIGSWRVKETDRIAAMACELRKLGATVEEGPDFIRITPPANAQQWRAASISTYDDHRMAMCFSLAAFNPAGLAVRIQHPACVAKTFPDYFETMFGLVQARAEQIPVICIDGPTASGKGTLAAALAKALGYHLLDSGALYRITALAAARAGLALDAAAEPHIAALARTLSIEFSDDRVLLAGADVSQDIRTEQVGMDASIISALPQVRAALVALQHGFSKLPGLVADGRDMGTVIFARATLKVFLTASADRRAQRRYKQLISKGISTTIATLRADLQARDARDTSRSVAPLQAAPDAQLLDNSDLSIQASVDQVLYWWQGKQPF